MGYICYEMEELLPIVAELADKYNGLYLEVSALLGTNIKRFLIT